ncbi:hypothetical protein H3005_19795 [Stenotrophomonas sp. Br8]|uniref:hypothetical protein n=1 Tax=Stenotrophomonas sp. Br8 TaxID=2759658 RepID=UPI00168AEBF6|nr:hypothetical protein [Stenotrophomonas sp. Br8]MBD3684100.1 hypothetical protein [Stenotrophomonas sp. Br8]
MNARIYDRPDLDQWQARLALYVVGTLPNAAPSQAYEGRLQIFNGVGDCFVRQIDGATLPEGHRLYVDQVAKQVVLAWPAYQAGAAPIENPGFESGPVGWDRGMGWVIATENPPVGSWAAGYNNQQGESIISNQARYTVHDGQVTRAKCKVRQGASSEGNAGASVLLEYRDAAGNVVRSVEGNRVMSASKNRVYDSEVVGVAQAGEATVNIAGNGIRHRENKILFVDAFEWDHTVAAAGIDHEATLCITLLVSDSAGRSTLWAGCIEVREGVLPPQLTDWRHLLTTLSDDSTAYAASDYNDSAWPVGDSPFGNLTKNPNVGLNAAEFYPGFSPVIKTQIPLNQRLWIRRTLTLPSVSDKGYQLIGYFDNGYTLYVNGVQQSQSSTGTNAGVRQYIHPDSFVAGPNVIAVRCDDDAEETSDDAAYFDFTLEMSLTGPGMQDLTFTEVATVEHVQLAPAALTQFSDDFATQLFVASSTSVPMAFSIASGALAVSSSSAGDKNLFIREGAGIGIPQQFVSIDVDAYSPPASGYAVVSAGIYKDANNWVYFEYDAFNSQLRIERCIGGAAAFVDTRTLSATAPYRLGFSLVGNTACGWIDTGSGWKASSFANMAGYKDFKAATDLDNWVPSILVAAGNTCSFTIGNFYAGRFGGVGIRDITTVTNEAGDPYIVDGKAYVTATTADHQGTAYQAVFRIDLAAYTLEQTAAIMVSRDGTVQNDLSGHIIRYSDTQQRLTTATWGNGFGQKIRILTKEVATDLLHGTHVISAMDEPVLPYTDDADDGTYDPFLVKDGEVWRLAYSFTENTNFVGDPFYAALAGSSDLVTWEPMGIDTVNRFEGTKQVKVGDSYQVLAGGRTSYRVFDTGMNFLGTMNAPIDGGSNTQPHPMVLPYLDKWVMLTFDGQIPSSAGVSAGFTWGRMRVNTAPRM